MTTEDSQSEVLRRRNISNNSQHEFMNFISTYLRMKNQHLKVQVISEATYILSSVNIN